MKIKNLIRFRRSPNTNPKPVVAVLANQNINDLGEGKLNVNSLTWAFIHSWATRELKKAREANDSPSRDHLQTQTLRGRIKLLKELIDLPKEKKFEEVEDYDEFGVDIHKGY